MKNLLIVTIILMLLNSWVIAADPPPETYRLHVHGEVEYRCYAGYDPKHVVIDSRTHQVCDNRTVKKVLFDHVIALTLKFEPNPDDETTLVGDWENKTDFQGRKLDATLTLMKEASQYDLRMSATDDEPIHRQTDVSSEFTSVKQMNPITVRDSSVGSNEEMTFTFKVEPVLK